MFRRLFFAAVIFLAVPAFSANVPPEFLDPGISRVLRNGGSAQEIDLQPLFRDPDFNGTAVRINFRIGTANKPVDIALFDAEKPITVANFLAYVNSGRFAENFIHRSVSGFIVQGGGFAWTTNGYIAVPTYEKIQNEPGLSNLRGTIAMAKLGGDPNSATSQWFVNLADNSANLDFQNGGFTVFGRVAGNGMAVLDEVAALPTVNAGAPFDNLPVKNFTGGTIFRAHTVETDAAITPSLRFSATSLDPALVTASMTGSIVTITPSANASGTALVTLAATDIDGSTTQATLTVRVRSKSEGWRVEDGSTFVLDAANTTPLAQDPVPFQWGSVALESSQTRTFTARNDGASTLTDYNATITGVNAAEFTITEGAGPITLSPGESTTITVAFAPAAGGSRTAALQLSSNNPDEASLQLALAGEGIDTIFPVITPATPQVLEATVMRTAQVPDWRGVLVNATDNAGVISFTQSPAPGALLHAGEYPLIFTATDAAGNTTTIETTLTVQYDTATLPEVKLSAAYSGAPVPVNGSAGLPDGSFFSAFGTPAISDDRSVASRVTITASRAKLAGIYFESETGQGRLVARQGQDSGVPFTKFKSFRDPLLSRDGAIAFAATLTGAKSTENEGVWTDLFGTLRPVLPKGADLPGKPGLKLKSVTSLSFDELRPTIAIDPSQFPVSGGTSPPQLLIRATQSAQGSLVISGPGNVVVNSNDERALLALVKLTRVRGGITAANDTALVRITGPTSSVVLAQTGESFDGSTIKQISVLQPAARSAGHGRWNGRRGTIAKLTLADRRVVIARLHSDGTKAALLRAGAPDSNAAGATFAKLSLPALGGSAVALLATHAKQSGVITGANDSTLLYAADGTTFTEVIREEPGAAKFSTFSDPVANDQGELLFFGTQRAAVPRTPNTTALWLSDGIAAPEIVARVGGPATDRAGQNIPDAAFSAFSSFALPDGPGAGPVFVGQLAGKGVTGQSKLGLWALDSGGVVRQLLRAGDDIVAPGGTKRVARFTVLNALPGSFGARRSYNATGALAVQVTFSDRSQAVLRLNVP